MTTAPPPPGLPGDAAGPGHGRSKRPAQLKAAVVLVVIGLFIAFIATNTRKVKVSFILWSARESVIVVILISTVVGFVGGWLARGWRASARRDDS